MMRLGKTFMYCRTSRCVVCIKRIIKKSFCMHRPPTKIMMNAESNFDIMGTKRSLFFTGIVAAIIVCLHHLVIINNELHNNSITPQRTRQLRRSDKVKRWHETNSPIVLESRHDDINNESLDGLLQQEQEFEVILRRKEEHHDIDDESHNQEHELEAIPQHQEDATISNNNLQKEEIMYESEMLQLESIATDFIIPTTL